MPAIDRYLDDCTRSLRLPPNLVEAIRYALLGGGKRLRPVLAWHACMAAGGRGEESLLAGAAVELIHAFSLVHDDLPAMDDDDLRRGKPTLHIHAGEAMAILAGDAMMAAALGMLVESRLSPELGAALVRELSAATAGMIAGQVYDTLGGLPAGLSDRQKLELIHSSKTGALIRAACRMGAMCAGSSAGPGACGGRPWGSPGEPASLAPLTAYAEALGMMFQIVDDLLDVECTPEQTGKHTRKDAKAGKLTFPGLIGVDASRREIDRLGREAIGALEPLGPHAAALRELCRRMAVRRS